MSLIYLATTLLLISVNLMGVALCLRAWLPQYLLAKVVGTIGLCLGLLFLEHFIGLGQLTWVWPISTGLSLYAIYVHREILSRELWRQELVFILVLLVYTGWRFSFPDIDFHSEQLTDLAFIVSYMPGHTLPPPDAWHPQLPLNMYYSFQHYAAALMGRIFDLSPGMTMNLAITVMFAFLASLVWFISGRYVQKSWLRGLVLFAVMAGGTGIAPLTHLIFNQSNPQQDHAFTLQNNIWANTRFAGMYDANVDTPLGKALFQNGQTNTPARDLPLETLGYLTLLGDYHPPLGGILLLFIALASISLIQTSTHARTQSVSAGILAATVPLTLITNTWVFPLQAFLFFAWLVSRHLQARPLYLRAVTIGFSSTLLLAFPMISHMAAHALHPPIKWTGSIDHTPWDRLLAVHWPELVILLLAAIGFRRKPDGLWLVIGLAVLLVCSELFFVDDPLADKYNRFNSVLKWWSWLYPAVILMLGSMLLEKGRYYRAATVVVLVLVSTAGLDLLGYALSSQKPSLGRLDGHAWLTRNATDSNILRWLQVMPRGTVLEGIDTNGAYIPASSLALFANKPSAIGWPDHEKEWRHGDISIQQFADATRQFYRGQLVDPLGWLRLNRIDYIVWRESDQKRAPKARERIAEQIKSEFYWIPIVQHDAYAYGIWYRKSIDFPI